jgi:hypothetical protein
MKIRSLLLGSVAAAGLSTGAYAADLGVLTSLDVCDALGLSGLTISSDTNCLQITGSVSYEFQWGDYKEAYFDEDADGYLTRSFGVIATEATTYEIPVADGSLDWKSRVDAWIKFVATADSDFGPAVAVIKIKETQIVNGFGTDHGDTDVYETVLFGGSDTAFGDGYYFDEAYVSIGDTTVIMAGKKGTIMNLGDDVPLNYLGLFNSEKVDTGVKWGESIPDGGHVIQVRSDLGNGVSIGVGLENLNDISRSVWADAAEPTSLTTGAGTAVYKAGTLVGVLSYAGDGISAHVTGVAGGVLDGVIENWGIHAGVAATFDPIKFVAAVAAGNNVPSYDEGGAFDSGDSDGIYWNALASVAATFDMFTIAVSGEAVTDRNSDGELTGDTDYGFGASIGASVTDGVTINLGGRWYRDASDNGTGLEEEAWQVEAQLVAAVTETITLTGAVGAIDSDDVTDEFGGAVFYGSAQAAWAPGGGFTSSLKGEAYSNGAYRATFKAAKTFE